MQPPITIFDLSLDELRERASLARQTIAEMRELLAQVMRERAAADDDDDDDDEDARLASKVEVMKLIHEGLDLVATLLPGLAWLTPEALADAIEKADDTAERGEEIGAVREAMSGLLEDLQKARSGGFFPPEFDNN